jgi:GNAT superfamily N-acetyltransferase
MMWGGVASILSVAFHEDLVLSWVFLDDESRQQQFRAFFDLIVRQVCLPQGLTFVTENLDAAILWEPPSGEWPVEPEIEEAAWIEITGPENYARLSALGDAMDAHRPDKRHVYLSLIGALPEAHGLGLDSALLDSGLIRWDREGVPTNLMSTNEANLPFYESRGYRVIAEVDLPDGGPRMWDMWREAGGG